MRGERACVYKHASSRVLLLALLLVLLLLPFLRSSPTTVSPSRGAPLCQFSHSPGQQKPFPSFNNKKSRRASCFSVFFLFTANYDFDALPLLLTHALNKTTTTTTHSLHTNKTKKSAWRVSFRPKQKKPKFRNSRLNLHFFLLSAEEEEKPFPSSPAFETIIASHSIRPPCAFPLD